MQNRRRNDRNARPEKGNFRRPGDRHAGASAWLWGRHPVEAALGNPRREDARRLVLAPGRTIAGAPPPGRRWPEAETMEPAEIARLLPAGAAHQGYALLAAPLDGAELEEMAAPARGVIVMLDQVTDPQNVGSILRSAAAFGARGVILQERRAPPLTGVLAKAAAGAVDKVPVARVVNLSRALDRLGDLGWRAIGLDSAADRQLDEILDGSPTVLVLGSEGEGLRRLVAEHCDTVASIAQAKGFESLNVAAAAAVALFQAAKLA